MEEAMARKSSLRLTIRFTMVIVFFAGLTVFITIKIYEECRWKCVRQERASMARLQAVRRDAADKQAASPVNDFYKRWHKNQSEYYSRLENKYGEGSKKPWIELEPDPPPPPAPYTLDQLLSESHEIQKRVNALLAEPLEEN